MSTATRARLASPEALFGSSGTPRVAVIGAGFGGIAAGVNLKRAGIETFTIYESSPEVGGTWWDNTYPGAEVDVNSNLYRYSFKSYDWTRTHAGQAELQAYLAETVVEFGLTPHLRVGVTVLSARWDDDRHLWTIHLDSGQVDECHAVISAVGFLNVPRYPDWPGMDEFEGPTFHTARWEHHHDLTNKVIAVVGTGSTAAQVVPALQKIARKVYLFQREPGWVLPKGERDPTAAERELRRRPGWRKRDRLRQRWSMEVNLWGGAMYRPGTKLNRAREDACRSYIAREFADRPDLRAAVTPHYAFPGKRPILATTYYPALKMDNVELVPQAVARLTRHGVIDADGVERSVDAVILATGFRAAEYLARFAVAGRGGRTLDEYWAGEPHAFLGITVPTFPNLYLLYGPGTNGGELVSMLEAQAEYAVRSITRMRCERVSSIEVRPVAAMLWNRWLQTKMRGTSWSLTRTYFTSASGKVVTQWPSGNVVYRILTKSFGRVSETTRRRSVVSDDDSQASAHAAKVARLVG